MHVEIQNLNAFYFPNLSKHIKRKKDKLKDKEQNLFSNEYIER